MERPLSHILTLLLCNHQRTLDWYDIRSSDSQWSITSTASHQICQPLKSSSATLEASQAPKPAEISFVYGWFCSVSLHSTNVAKTWINTKNKTWEAKKMRVKQVSGDSTEAFCALCCQEFSVDHRSGAVLTPVWHWAPNKTWCPLFGTEKAGNPIPHRHTSIQKCFTTLKRSQL